jgi:hypothetical protein
MSWETFVFGTLEIAPDISEKKKTTIIEDFEEVLEKETINTYPYSINNQYQFIIFT